jgi:hypothetical protein
VTLKAVISGESLTFLSAELVKPTLNNHLKSTPFLSFVKINKKKSKNEMSMMDNSPTEMNISSRLFRLAT